MAHDAHFDGEPATELPPDEPRTPNWVPVLGLCLLLAAAVYWVASGASAAPTAQAEPTGRPAAPTPLSTVTPPSLAAGRPTAMPLPVGSAGVRQPMTPEQAEQLRKRIEEARKRREANPGANQPAPPAALPPSPPR